VLERAHRHDSREHRDRDEQQRVAMRSNCSQLPRDAAGRREPHERERGDNTRRAGRVVQQGLQQPLIAQREGTPHIIEEPASDREVDSSVA
jgi:hypothetical protein